MSIEELRPVVRKLQQSGVTGVIKPVLEVLKSRSVDTAESFVATSDEGDEEVRAYWVDGELLRTLVHTSDDGKAFAVERAYPLSRLHSVETSYAFPHVSGFWYWRRSVTIRLQDVEPIELDGGQSDPMEETPFSRFVDALTGALARRQTGTP